jgi:hypothetical protein
MSITKSDLKSHNLKLYSIHEIFQTLFTRESIWNENPNN